MNEQTLRFRIGVFILASLLLLAVLITLFGSFPRLFTFSGCHQSYSRMSRAGCRSFRSPFRGAYRRGQVHRSRRRNRSGASPDPDLSEIHSATQPGSDPGPWLARRRRGHRSSRREEVAQADRTPVEPGSELQGVPQATVSTLLDQASDVVPVAKSALKEIRDSLKRLDKLTPILEETAKEYRDLAKLLREVLPELKTTTKEVGDLAKAGREALPELKTTTKEVGDLAKAAQEALPDLRTTTKEVGDLAKDVRENVPELKKTSHRGPGGFCVGLGPAGRGRPAADPHQRGQGRQAPERCLRYPGPDRYPPQRRESAQLHRHPEERAQWPANGRRTSARTPTRCSRKACKRCGVSTGRWPRRTRSWATCSRPRSRWGNAAA